MDLMMPKMGGDETISRFRQWESINRVGQRRQAICILSGSENFKHKYKQMGTLQCAVLFPIVFSHAIYIIPLAPSGADFMLTKPCEARKMKAVIEQACDMDAIVGTSDETDRGHSMSKPFVGASAMERDVFLAGSAKNFVDTPPTSDESHETAPQTVTMRPAADCTARLTVVQSERTVSRRTFKRKVDTTAAATSIVDGVRTRAKASKMA